MPKAYTAEDWIIRFREVHQPDRYNYLKFYMVQEHGRNRPYFEIQCTSCGNIFQQRAKAHAKGHGCRECAKQTNSQKMKEHWSDPQYHSRMAPVASAIISEQNRKQWADPNFRLKMSKVSSENMKRLWADPDFRAKCLDNQPQGDSQGVKFLKETLKDFGLRYDTEVFLPGTRYRFDFYLPDFDVYIEYHGSQHYKGWSNNPEDLRAKIKRDEYKADWAMKNGHGLIVIPYTDVDNIPAIISNLFSD